MKTEAQLKEFYQTDLMADLLELETHRRRIVNNSTMVAVVIGVLGLIMAAVIAASTRNPIIAIFPLIIGVIIAAIAFAAIGSGFRSDFKLRIIGKLVKFISPDLSYTPDGLITQPVFQASELFTQGIDRYSGEDLIRGRVDKTEIAFSEVHAEYKTTSRDSKGRTQTHWHTLFKGLFFTADFNKHFSGQTRVLPDTAERLFGRFGQMLQSFAGGRSQLIKLEDPEFEREFAVYGTDQIEARYILSPALMQRIMEFKRKTRTQISLSFTGSKVYVAVPMSRNLFEPKFFRNTLDFDPIREYFQDLTLAIGIVEDLNLNTRIWTKQ